MMETLQNTKKEGKLPGIVDLTPNKQRQQFLKSDFSIRIY